MNTLKNITILGLLAASLGLAQLNTLVATTLSAAATATDTKITVASATGINAPSSTQAGSALYIVDEGQSQGELVRVTAVSSTTISIRRTGRAVAHASGAMVLVATNANWFYSTNPSGSCTRAETYVAPWLNTNTGQQWICSTESLTWTPGWGNLAASAQIVNSSATASVAGATAIAGPLLKISGTNAITSFTMGVGWNGNNFCVYPTGAFTGTATNNIAKAFTAVADRILCFVWDTDGGTFSPSY